MTSPVTDTTTKINVQSMQNLSRHLQKDLELVNGLSLDQVLRKSGILTRIVHKELGIILRKRCY